MARSPEQQIQRLEQLADHTAGRKPIQHVAMSVETDDGSFRWTGVRGPARPGGPPLEVDTPFFIASIDKLFNACVAMQLSADRLLDLDQPIAVYLPEAIAHRLHFMNGVDRTGRVTVRHLLGHTSGLADWLEDRGADGRSLVERVVEDGDRDISVEDIARFVRNELKPHFPPQDLSATRQKVRYSDTNYILLVAVIEAVTGEPLHRIHEHMVLRPLNLRRTYFLGRSEPLDETTAEPAALHAAGRPLHIPLFLRSIWGMYSTTGDLMRFMRGLVRGNVFHDPDILSTMQRRWNRFGFPMDRAALRAPGWPIEYGLGIMRVRLPRLFAPIHAMPGVLGHSGSTGCWLFHCPEQKMLLSGSVDEVTAGAVPYRIVPRMLRILHSAG